MQGVHIKNGCAWLNHGASDDERRVFARACKKYPQIRAWFSGHFHLSHDFEDSISECGVIGSDSSRDGRRQTRIVSGAQDGLRIYTVSHHLGGQELRLDATIRYQDIEDVSSVAGASKRIVIAHGHQDYDHTSWFSAYTPMPLDGCYMESRDGLIAAGPHQANAVCWWHMADGRVLGVHDAMTSAATPCRTVHGPLQTSVFQTLTALQCAEAAAER
eukprot:1713-Heterococcus_DN1.PRE.1